MPTHYDDKKKVPGTRAKKLQARPSARPEVDGATMLQAVLDVPTKPTLLPEPERPEFDRRRAKGLEYAAAASLLGAGLGAAFDLPLSTNLMSGLSSGYSTGLENLNTRYAEELAAYQDQLFDTRSTNAKMGEDARQHALDLREKIEHNQATEAHQGARISNDAERNAEIARHNREMEKIGARNAGANETRAEKYQGGSDSDDVSTLTGRWLASTQIDASISRLERQIEDLSQTRADAIINKDRIEELQDQVGALTRQKYDIMAGMKGADLDTFLGDGPPAVEGGGPVSRSSGAPLIGGPIDDFLRNNVGAQPGPHPTPRSAPHTPPATSRRQSSNPPAPVPGGPLESFIQRTTGQQPQLGPVPSERGPKPKKKSKYGLEELF